MKKLTVTVLAILLVAIFILSSVAAPAFASFGDVSSVHVNYDAINYVQEEGIVEGYPDGTYKPDQNINRAEFTKIIVGALLDYNPTQDPSGYDIYVPVGLSFTDLISGEWYIPYLRKAVENGIISGYPDGTFKPADNINFAEAAKILVKGFDFEYYENREIWYRPYVQVLEGQKAIPTTIKSFDQKVTRGEMAEMIYRLKTNNLTKPTATYETLAKGVSPDEQPGTPIAVKLYFHSTTLDPEMMDCSKVFEVERMLPEVENMELAVMEELLKGPSAAELQAGYFTNINQGVEINSITVNNGTATADFDEQLQYAVGGSCKVTSIRAQITETLKQFTTIQNVVISIEGQTEDILQP